ncbi:MULTISPECIES: MoaD/ThiS family protein [Micrococcaceae]|uniref:MoaD/ThiS family protein n=1 Tax=Glutamicibacter ectropisis TaxID=3046593 RepID=A0AAU6WET1_9MICC|nr:MoaD/ThiS family protein [Arthrobacter sp. NIO-1057]KSU65697.1 molybdopterin synthase sulfur carrier subunit [Arthrobacter sp. NIO-1057]SCC40886.1 Molybdopterin converting factor, small subunit [Arthrobacter sp. NIO-1057]
MSKITIRYFAAAAAAAGCEQESWERPPTLAALRSELIDSYGPEMAQVLRAGSFLINGVVRRDAGELGPEENLTVDVLPPFAGG